MWKVTFGEDIKRGCRKKLLNLAVPFIIYNSSFIIKIMVIPLTSDLLKQNMTTETLTQIDIQLIKEWVKNNNIGSVGMLVVFGIIFFISLYIFLNYYYSPAFWIGFVSFVLICVIGSSMLFYSYTNKTLTENKKRVLVVTISEKIIKRERVNNKQNTDVPYLYFGNENINCIVEKEAWDKYKIGQKIKFHFFLDQSFFFKYETVE